MYDWVRALIDPTEIAQTPSSAKKNVTPPPKYELSPLDLLPSSASRARTRRSVSPSKRPSSPRKSKSAKPAATAKKERDATDIASSIPAGVPETVEETIETEKKANGEAQPRRSKPTRRSKRNPTPLREQENATEDKSTKPAPSPVKEAEENIQKEEEGEKPLLPELPAEANPTELISEAKEMVEQANKEEQSIEGEASEERPTKRKTDPLSEDLGEAGERLSEVETQRVKRAKVLEDKLKRERVRNRALVGVTAALAVA